MHAFSLFVRISALTVAALVTSLLMPLGSAHAQTGGPSGGWHWIDNAGASPLLTSGGEFQDLSDTGTFVPSASYVDEASTAITAPFPLRINGVESTTLTFNSNGFVSVGAGLSGASIFFAGRDLYTRAVNIAALGTAPNRQFVVNAEGLQYYGNPSRGADVSLTFFEQHPGVLVSYANVIGEFNTDIKVGLAAEAGNPGASLAVSYPASAIASGTRVMYTNSNLQIVPDLLAQTHDALGNTVVWDQPTGSADLSNAGRVRLSSSDSGTVLLNLPFTFTYYGTEYSQLGVSADSAFRFGSGSIPNSGLSMSPPDGSYPDSGVVWGQDLLSTISTQVRGTAPNRQYVVAWDGFRYGDPSANGRVKVRMVLFEANDEIGFLYPDVPPTTSYLPQRIGFLHSNTERTNIARLPVDGDSLLWTVDESATRQVIAGAPAGIGPDGYGYLALRNTDAGGPTYDWIDASDANTVFSLTDTTMSTTTAPFPVSLYGSAPSTTLQVNSDGYLNINAGETGNEPFPSGAQRRIQPVNMDLVTTVFTKTVGTSPHRKFVVEWSGFRYGDVAKVVKHEVVFFEDSTDVLMQFHTVYNTGEDYQVGINAGDSQNRLRVSPDGKDLANGTAILFSTSPILDLGAPAQLRPDGAAYSFGNTILNRSETPLADTSATLNIDGISGIAASQITVTSLVDDSEVSLDDLGNGVFVSEDLPGTALAAFEAGKDASSPFTITIAPGAPSGQLRITSTLKSNTGANVIARQTAQVPVVTTAPDAPTSFVATPVAGGNVTISWAAGASNGGSPVTGYSLTIKQGDTVHSVLDPGTGPTYTVEGLTVGTTYTATMTAHNAVGTSSPSSTATFTPYTTPAKVATPTATRGNTQATVSWTAPDSRGRAITSYTVTASPGGATATVGGALTQANVTGLSNGTAYTFTVRATNLAGPSVESDPSDAVTPAGAPSAPTSVTATAGNGQATVTWTAPADNGAAITGYTVTSSPGNLTADVGAGLTQATITGLTNGTAYTFTVRATNEVGSGAASQPSSAVTPALPSTTITATLSSKAIKLRKSSVIFGTLTPALDGENVIIEVLKGRTWTLVKSVPIKSQAMPNGSTAVGYKLSIKGTAKGTFSYRARYAGTPAQAPATSNVVKLKVTK